MSDTLREKEEVVWQGCNRTEHLLVLASRAFAYACKSAGRGGRRCSSTAS